MKYIGDGTAAAAAKHLHDSGLLFEINRQVLHPLGLALSVACDDETGEVLGFAGLWDSTDDPEGIAFSLETYVEGQEKLDKYLKDVNVEEVYRKRGAALGYVLQYESRDEERRKSFSVTGCNCEDCEYHNTEKWADE